MLEKEAACHPVPERDGDVAWWRQQQCLHREIAHVKLPIDDEEHGKQRRNGSIDDRAPQPPPMRRCTDRRSNKSVLGLAHAVACMGRRAAPSLRRARMRATCAPNTSLLMIARLRGRGRSTAISSTTRPGRGDITITRSARKTDSVIECVMS